MNKKVLKNEVIKTYHSYHLVDPSPWPILAAISAFMITFGLTLFMHKYKGGCSLILSGLILFSIVNFGWWWDIIWEATFEKAHSWKVQRGLRLGMVLFLISEAMFFFSFFWAFFYASLNPSYAIGGVWPPKAITPVNAFGIPLVNTFILLTSGASVTWAHHSVREKAKALGVIGLVLTLILAISFIRLQAFEYAHAPFHISDGIYASCFYVLTGFHGLHVFIGTCALFVSLIRLGLNHFSSTSHFGLEASIWYWHFVDVVWLLLFISVYWWGSN